MTRIYINEIQPQTQVDEVFRVVDKQQRANRQGGLYILMQLADRTGTISGLRWNADDRLYASFQKGDYVRVQAAAQLHNGLLQLIVHRVEVVESNEVDLADFERLDTVQVEKLWSELKVIIDSIQSEEIRAIADAFYRDSEIESQFKVAPAGVKAHHAFPGGLLTHVMDLMKLADLLAARYPNLDRDLLLVGTMLHDIGKLEELSFAGELNYTDPGQLVGHLVQGVQMLDRKVAEAEKSLGRSISMETQWRLQHMIVSHHGSLEHGSPRVPMTLEAIALHQIDDLDAKLNAATEFIRADRNADSAWTTFNPLLGRKLYKPSDRSA
jgi:3'-5' exoribonuclease